MKKLMTVVLAMLLAASTSIAFAAAGKEEPKKTNAKKTDAKKTDAKKTDAKKDGKKK